jgi:hypothetical protein
MYIISLIAHSAFYGRIIGNINSYKDFYLHTSGKGYITVFFDWMPLGLLLMLQASVKSNKKIKKSISLLLILFYILFYLFVLMRRRQIILLAFGIMVIFSDKKIFKNKLILLILGIIFYVMLMVFGKVRGIYQIYGLEYTLQYIVGHFSFEWIKIKSTEGRAASMILNDIIEYVQTNGITLKPLLGAATVYIPNSLFGVNYSAFPSWYTKMFHQEMLQGGYAGSFIAEFYLYFSFPAVVFIYFIIGIFLKKIEKISRKNLSVLLSLVMYIIFILPRLDLASLIILLIFQISPIILMYLIAGKLKIFCVSECNAP